MYETLTEQPRRTQYSSYFKLLCVRWPEDSAACELLMHRSLPFFFIPVLWMIQEGRIMACCGLYIMMGEGDLSSARS